MLRAPALAIAIVAALAGCACTQTIQWRHAESHARTDSLMVFDNVRNRFVALANPFDQWGRQLLSEWDGVSWRPRAPIDAGWPRQHASMAFDRARGRVILFGGEQNGQPLNDVSEYDGVAWTVHAPTYRPSPRFNAPLTFDLARGRILLAGGSARQSNFVIQLRDTWSWDGQHWSQLGAVAPQLAAGAMTSHPSTGTVVMSGVAAIGATTSQTWVFDGTNWTQRQPQTSPPGANDYRMATDLAADRALLLAGQSAPVWRWDGANWTAGPALDGRSNCAFAVDDSGRALVFGGERSGRLLTDTQLVDTAGVHSVGDGPGDTWYLAIEFELTRNVAVMVGQIGQIPQTATSATWMYDGARWVAGPAPPAGTPNTLLPLCHDLLRGRTVRLPGGSANVQEWDGNSWRTVPATGPRVLGGETIAFDLLAGLVVLVTDNALTRASETWGWDGLAWRQLATGGPARGAGRSAAYDVARGRMVLFGGTAANNTATNETWEWDGSSWTRMLPAQAPTPRVYARLAFDFNRQHVVLVGGQGPTGVEQNEAWEWTGTTWVRGTCVMPRNMTFPFLGPFGPGRWIFVTPDGTWLGAAVSASSETSGNGCGGTLVPALLADGDPVSGSGSFAVELARAPASAPFLLGFGAGRADVPIGAGCSIYLPQLDGSLVGTTAATGYASVPLPVPAAPQFIGLEVSLQTAVLDVTAPLGFALSNALVARIGR